MAIEPPQWMPQIKPRRESKARMWEMCWERKVQGYDEEGVGPIASNRPRFCHSPEGVITLVSEPCVVTPPHYRGMSIHTGHLHYP